MTPRQAKPGYVVEWNCGGEWLPTLRPSCEGLFSSFAARLVEKRCRRANRTLTYRIRLVTGRELVGWALYFAWRDRS
jgi:hypothetical protein